MMFNLINHPKPNPSEQNKNAAFSSCFMMSYVLYDGIMISFQHVCDIGNFFGFAPDFSNLTVIFEVW